MTSTKSWRSTAWQQRATHVAVLELRLGQVVHDVVRLDVAALLQHHGVGGVDVLADDLGVGGGDHVDVTGFERLGLDLRVDDDAELDLVEVRQLVARLVLTPVARVAGHRHAVTLQVLLDDERPGADRLGRQVGVAVDGRQPRRRGDEAGLGCQQVRQQRPRLRRVGVAVLARRQRERVVVDLLRDERLVRVLGQILQGARDQQSAGVAVEVVDHGVGVERRAVGERDAFAHLDREQRRVLVGLDALAEERVHLQVVAGHEQRLDEGPDAHVAVRVALHRRRRPWGADLGLTGDHEATTDHRVHRRGGQGGDRRFRILVAFGRSGRRAFGSRRRRARALRRRVVGRRHGRRVCRPSSLRLRPRTRRPSCPSRPRR